MTHFYNTLSTQNLTLDVAELAARLQVRRGYTHQAIEAGIHNLMGLADCRYCARLVSIVWQEGIPDLGFGPLNSTQLSHRLAGCNRAFVLAVTTGLGIDRLLARLNATSSVEHFIADAVGSALAESACELACRELAQDLCCTPRFSPGYGDLPLEIQPALLDFLDARKLLGIHLNKSLLMTPQKSITAIMGIKDEE
ncbi:MAG: hypothetical protein IJD09_00410 [Clostridia bacterium]|nr:hypothetical protein [Clostridia bacterium]